MRAHLGHPVSVAHQDPPVETAHRKTAHQKMAGHFFRVNLQEDPKKCLVHLYEMARQGDLVEMERQVHLAHLNDLGPNFLLLVFLHRKILQIYLYHSVASAYSHFLPQQ
jgi:hypothetical protein